MDKFLEKYNLPKLNQEETESLNRLITMGEIEAVIQKLPTDKGLDLMVSQVNFTKHLMKNLLPSFSNYPTKIQEEGRLPNSSRPVSSSFQNQVKI